MSRVRTSQVGRGMVVLCLLMAFPTYADSYLVLGDSTEPAGISGFAATEKKINVGEFDTTYELFSTGTQAHGSSTRTVTTYAGIKGITWREDKDKPCDMVVDAKELVSGLVYGDSKTAAVAPNGDFGICGGKPGNEKRVRLSAAAHYVRGVQVCTTDKKNSDDNRLKGIRLYIAEVKADGSVTALNNYEQDRHTNCAVWRTTVSCPAGHIASGVRVHHRGGYFTGLGLKCRKVEVGSQPHKS